MRRDACRIRPRWVGPLWGAGPPAVAWAVLRVPFRAEQRSRWLCSGQARGAPLPGLPATCSACGLALP